MSDRRLSRFSDEVGGSHERITRTFNQLKIKTSDMIIDEYFISFAPTR